MSPVRHSATSLSALIGSWQDRPGPAYRKIALAIKQAVLDGRLSIGARLPAERELAGALGVSRTTVSGGYTALREEGWLVSRRGSGSVIAIGHGSQLEQRVLPSRLPMDGDTDLIDLTIASPTAPAEALDAAIERAASRMRALYDTGGYFPLGVPELRERVAQRYSAEGAPTSADQILITNGAQHGFSLALADSSHALDRVIIESPTYPMALDLIRHSGRVPFGIGLLPESDQPWMHDLLRSTFRQSAASTAFLIPDFQNPTGALMDAPTRALVMECAEESGTTVVVDESFRQMSLDDTALPAPMASFDPGGLSISIGSLSKSVWGGLRIGWVRAQPSVITRLGAARALGDMSGSLLDQLIALELLDDLDTLARAQAVQLRAAREALLAALAQHAPQWQALRPAGGATMWVRLPQAVATDAASLAPSRGVLVVPGPRFGPDGTMDNYLRFPLVLGAELLTAAVPRVVAAVHAAEQTRRPGGLRGWLT